MAEINHAVRVELQARPERFGNGATGQANALRNCAFSAGITFGPLVAGLVKEQFGWAVMARAFAVAGAVACVCTVLWAGGWLLETKHEEEEEDDDDEDDDDDDAQVEEETEEEARAQQLEEQEQGWHGGEGHR